MYILIYRSYYIQISINKFTEACIYHALKVWIIICNVIFLGDSILKEKINKIILFFDKKYKIFRILFIQLQGIIDANK